MRIFVIRPALIQRIMKQKEKLEERLFCADIDALRAYDAGFDKAWQNGSKYEMEIKLSKLFEICPRKYARSREYNRLIRLLATKDITLTVVSRKSKTTKNNIIMKKYVYISDCVFDANADTKEKIEADVQAHFDSHTKPGNLKFTYDKTANGYKYRFDRYLPYGYKADVIIDIDCSFLTGLPIEAFQLNLLDPNHRPLVYCFVGRCTDGYYAPTKLFEDFYILFLGHEADAEEPKKVKVSACSCFVNVEVEY